MTIYDDIELERRRAHEKHVASNDSMEDRSAIDPYWLPIALEEFGEVVREIILHTVTTRDLVSTKAHRKYVEMFANLEKAEKCARELCDNEMGTVSVSIPNIKALRLEMIQCLAMLSAWVEALDRMVTSEIK